MLSELQDAQNIYPKENVLQEIELYASKRHSLGLNSA
jgi:hypothetical protein